MFAPDKRPDRVALESFGLQDGRLWYQRRTLYRPHMLSAAVFVTVAAKSPQHLSRPEARGRARGGVRAPLCVEWARTSCQSLEQAGALFVSSLVFANTLAPNAPVFGREEM